MVRSTISAAERRANMAAGRSDITTSEKEAAENYARKEYNRQYAFGERGKPFIERIKKIGASRTIETYTTKKGKTATRVKVGRGIFEEPEIQKQWAAAPRRNTASRLVQQLFPGSGVSISQSPRQLKGRVKYGRGRPTGTVKYYIPGKGPAGVYEYRRYLRSIKRVNQAKQSAQIAAMMAAKAGMRQAQQGNPQQYQQPRQMQPTQTSYPQQIMQQQGYNQAIQQQMMPQYPQFQQIQQMPQRREIIPVFKSSGGHPYAPVNETPRFQNNSNAPYYMDIDLMTSRPIMIKRPQAEAWIRPRI